MPQPNLNVVKALIENYLTTRASENKLSDEKKEICRKVLLKAKDAKNTNDWINVVYLISYEEENQKNIEQTLTKTATKAIISRIPFVGTHFSDGKDLLLQTLTAIRSYLLTQLDKEPELENVRSYVASAQTNANTQITTSIKQFIAASDKTDYHSKYFTDYIKESEPKAKELDEKSFADFEQNCCSNKRTFLWCEMLSPTDQAEIKINQTKSTTTQLQKQFTPPVTNIPSAAPTNNEQVQQIKIETTSVLNPALSQTPVIEDKVVKNESTTSSALQQDEEPKRTAPKPEKTADTDVPVIKKKIKKKPGESSVETIEEKPTEPVVFRKKIHHREHDRIRDESTSTKIESTSPLRSQSTFKVPSKIVPPQEEPKKENPKKSFSCRRAADEYAY
ncbi:MAG: hypothetical protein ACD_46C00623G0002 [uncultured bacterium]|nr:MAG: hypothetical protein ACD_46C00623G0002 [uncultured bacterium]